MDFIELDFAEIEKYLEGVYMKLCSSEIMVTRYYSSCQAVKVDVDLELVTDDKHLNVEDGAPKLGTFGKQQIRYQRHFYHDIKIAFYNPPPPACFPENRPCYFSAASCFER